MCAPKMLHMSLRFGASGSSNGAIDIANASKRACSLSGRPEVAIFDHASQLVPTRVIAMPSTPQAPEPPDSTVRLQPGTSQGASVMVLWSSCVSNVQPFSWKLKFRGWGTTYTIPYSDVSPSGFAPSSCVGNGSGTSLLSLSNVYNTP